MGYSVGMSDREAELEQSRRLSRMLILVAERAKMTFAESVSPFGLPVPLARALLVLATPTPMRELADHLACDPSYITGLADQLEERGLARRCPGTDRRVKLLEATQEGFALRDRISLAVTERAFITQRLDPPERETLARLLEQILDE